MASSNRISRNALRSPGFSTSTAFAAARTKSRASGSSGTKQPQIRRSSNASGKSRCGAPALLTPPEEPPGTARSSESRDVTSASTAWPRRRTPGEPSGPPPALKPVGPVSAPRPRRCRPRVRSTMAGKPAWRKCSTPSERARSCLAAAATSDICGSATRSAASVGPSCNPSATPSMLPRAPCASRSPSAPTRRANVQESEAAPPLRRQRKRASSKTAPTAAFNPGSKAASQPKGAVRQAAEMASNTSAWAVPTGTPSSSSSALGARNSQNSLCADAMSGAMPPFWPLPSPPRVQVLSTQSWATAHAAGARSTAPELVWIRFPSCWPPRRTKAASSTGFADGATSTTGCRASAASTCTNSWSERVPWMEASSRNKRRQRSFSGSNRNRMSSSSFSSGLGAGL
mmetsp:Transcript_86545/g.242375  ORF Transcript_86545/g.242375 Transcript_86545/m.242375 type:complete len:401 (+) Transcript_86545:262-1464(+)